MKEHLLEYIDKATSHSVRGLRILTEYFYATEIFEPIVKSNTRIVSVFGSARRKQGTWEYDAAKKLGALLYQNGYAVVTGASSGIMQAANEGVAEGIIAELKKKKKYKSDEEVAKSPEFKKILSTRSVGLKITLPFEPVNNPWVGIYATFHYFMVRKFFFGSLSSAFIACEGGWGTRDELFEILTLVQTGKAPLMPIIYVSPDPDHLLKDIEYCVRKEYISPEDKHLIQIVGDYKKAVEIVNSFYSVVKRISYETKPDTCDITLAKPLSAKQKSVLKNKIEKDFKKIFSGIVFRKDGFELTGFNYRSYGIVRSLIDLIAKTR